MNREPERMPLTRRHCADARLDAATRKDEAK
jgi:hypothetical protein